MNQRNSDGYEIGTYLWSSAVDREVLRSLGEEITIPKNTIIHTADEIPAYAYYILSGRVISFEYTANGNERIYAISSNGSLVLDESLILQRAIPVSFRTTRETRAVRIDRDAIYRAVTADPEFAIAIIQSTAEKMLSAMEIIRQSTSTNASWKVCNLLLTFARQYGVEYDNKILIEEKISQQTIANLLGLNRIITLRVMKDLKDMGLIEQINGLYCIRDMDRLHTHMEYLEAES